MRVENGSQNLSSVPGTYAYPLRKYSKQPISPLAKVDGKAYTTTHKRQFETLSHTLFTMKKEHPAVRDTLTYSNKKNNLISTNGLFTNTSLYKGLHLDINV